MNNSMHNQHIENQQRDNHEKGLHKNLCVHFCIWEKTDLDGLLSVPDPLSDPWDWCIYLSNEKKPWLFTVYRGFYTTQLYGDYNKPV